jgi:hypothetical protein
MCWVVQPLQVPSFQQQVRRMIMNIQEIAAPDLQSVEGGLNGTRLLKDVAAGAGIGSLVGAPAGGVGSAIGGAIGAAVGFLVGLFDNGG